MRRLTTSSISLAGLAFLFAGGHPAHRVFVAGGLDLHFEKLLPGLAEEAFHLRSWAGRHPFSARADRPHWASTGQESWMKSRQQLRILPASEGTTP